MDLFGRARSVIDHRVPSTTRHGSSNAPPTQTHGHEDRVASASQTKVRAILDEMKASASWGEKEHEGEEKRLLDALEFCILDAPSRHALEKLPKRMCAYEFKPGDIAWNCKVCQVGTGG